MEKKEKKYIVVITVVFSCGLCCQCPCPHSEPLLFPAYPGSPLILLGVTLDLLWALWGQPKLWSGLTPTFTCPQSPQPHLWEHSSIHIFHRCRVYQSNWRGLIHSSCGSTESFPSFFFGRTTPGFQLWFWPCLCLSTTLRHLVPTQASGGESSGWLGLTWSLRLGRERALAVTIEMAGSSCSGRDQQEVATAWGASWVLLEKLALNCGNLGSGGLHRLLGRCGKWPVLAHRTLGGSSRSHCPPLVSKTTVAAHSCLWSWRRHCPASVMEWSRKLLWQPCSSPWAACNSGLLPLQQAQAFSQTPSWLALAY